MFMSPEYIKEQEKEILGCSRYASQGGSSERYATIASFCKNFENILSVGSAAYEPIKIKATYALDVHPIAGKMLKKNGWKGKFVIGDCRELPFPDKSFECGCCSDVVEHLPTGNDVVRTVKELNRVCRNWILTSPNKWEHQPIHKRVLTDEDLIFLSMKTGANWRRYMNWYFMWKGEHEPTFP